MQKDIYYSISMRENTTMSPVVAEKCGQLDKIKGKK